MVACPGLRRGSGQDQRGQGEPEESREVGSWSVEALLRRSGHCSLPHALPLCSRCLSARMGTAACLTYALLLSQGCHNRCWAVGWGSHPWCLTSLPVGICCS